MRTYSFAHRVHTQTSWLFAHLLGEKWHHSTVSVFIHLFMSEVEYLLYVEESFPCERSVHTLHTVCFWIVWQLSLLYPYPIDIHLCKPKATCVDTSNTLPQAVFLSHDGICSQHIGKVKRPGKLMPRSLLHPITHMRIWCIKPPSFFLLDGDGSEVYLALSPRISQWSRVHRGSWLANLHFISSLLCLLVFSYSIPHTYFISMVNCFHSIPCLWVNFWRNPNQTRFLDSYLSTTQNVGAEVPFVACCQSDKLRN